MVKLEDIIKFQEDFVRLTGYTEDTPYGDYLLDIPKEELSTIQINTNEHGYTTWEVSTNNGILKGEFGEMVGISRFFEGKAKKLRVAKNIDEGELRYMEFMWVKYKHIDLIPILGSPFQGAIFAYEENERKCRELALRFVEEYIEKFKQGGLPNEGDIAKIEEVVNYVSTAELDLVKLLRKRIEEERL